MYLYLVNRRDDPGYDEFKGTIVAAPNAATAKRLVPTIIGDINPNTLTYWTPGNLTTQVIGIAHHRYTKPTIVLADYWPG